MAVGRMKDGAAREGTGTGAAWHKGMPLKVFELSEHDKRIENPKTSRTRKRREKSLQIVDNYVDFVDYSQNME